MPNPMPTAPLKAIRAFCVECMGGSVYAVKDCPSAPGTRYQCPLYPFRQGINPYREKRVLTEERKAELAKQLQDARKKQTQNA